MKSIYSTIGDGWMLPGLQPAMHEGRMVTLTSGAHAGRKVWVMVPNTKPPPASDPTWDLACRVHHGSQLHCDNYGIDTITTAGGMGLPYGVVFSAAI